MTHSDSLVGDLPPIPEPSGPIESDDPTACRPLGDPVEMSKGRPVELAVVDQQIVGHGTHGLEESESDAGIRPLRLHDRRIGEDRQRRSHSTGVEMLVAHH